MIYRLYVSRKSGFDVEARHLAADIYETTGVPVKNLAVISRYDIEGIDEKILSHALYTVFAEPQSDEVCAAPEGGTIIAVEPLPGQFDQRAESAEQCVQLLTGGVRPRVRSAKLYSMDKLCDEDAERVKCYLINPVECREASSELPDTLDLQLSPPSPAAAIDGFRDMDDAALCKMIEKYGLAMDVADLGFLRQYFVGELRDPTLTELKVVDTYWSDHCRHTTFLTTLDRIEIEDERIKRAFDSYLDARCKVYGKTQRPVTLMDIATIGAKALKKRGLLKNLDESDEINACSVLVDAKIDGNIEQWVVMFKNETHNHPTEIEPFGGAATCLGGAIRDPLSGRSYVYQAMRVTGASDPRVKTQIEGKLPRRLLTRTAAAGYSSYGNQIGIATGLVDEVYHEGYAAKRLEIGAVVGAAPKVNIRREQPRAGDVVILVGGKTGRDGIGGATGSSKAQGKTSVQKCAAEVQKGNPPEERKLQRLFRDPKVAQMIKRCNDFGAGGVSVAVGELADGLYIYLDRVPKKYEGLDATELAISESQERMAVVVEAKDAERFIAAAEGENLEATQIADVTADPRLVMEWQGGRVVDISREFLNTNGATRSAAVCVAKNSGTADSAPAKTRCCMQGFAPPRDAAYKLTTHMSHLRAASRRGLAERFDASIGASSILAPYGGRSRRTPAQSMAALLPSYGGAVSSTATVMAYGLDPELCESDPFGGGAAAVVASLSKLVASGCDYRDAYLSLQEYFKKLGDDPKRWAEPFSALLGAFDAQMGLEVAAIGGKDSMSGSYLDMDVPPTLCSFALATVDAAHVISPEFKAGDESVYIAEGSDYERLRASWSRLREYVRSGRVTAAWAIGTGTAGEGICKMSFGNGVGFRELDGEFDFYARNCGAIIFTSPDELNERKIGVTTTVPFVELGGERVSVEALCAAWEAPLESTFPTRTASAALPCRTSVPTDGAVPYVRTAHFAMPRAVIPTFPGTNCELDTARAVERAGGAASVLLIRNLNAAALTESVEALIAGIKSSQMLVLPGGFSGGDEPDGSAKFIVSLFRNPAVADAVHDLLYKRDGLVLGICNGFQALVKLGLLPTGRISPTSERSPTLTHNNIGRHAARYVYTRVETTASPWLRHMTAGRVHAIPVSHGEGRFMAPPDVIDALFASGQVAFRYCTPDGVPSCDEEFNPNGSVDAIEGIISADGRILGKMGHSERNGTHVGINVIGDKFQPLFEGGVGYYR